MYWRTMIAVVIGLDTMVSLPYYPAILMSHYTLCMAIAIPFYFSIAVFTISCGVLLDAVYKYPSPFSTMVFRVAKVVFDTIVEMDLYDHCSIQ